MKILNDKEKNIKLFEELQFDSVNQIIIDNKKRFENKNALFIKKTNYIIY